MDRKLSNWNSAALEAPPKKSKFYRNVFLAAVLVLLSVAAIGVLSPTSPQLPKPLPGEGTFFISTELVVQKNAALTVSEHTRIRFQGTTPRHGINRGYPSVVLTEDGKSTAIQFHNVSARVAPWTDPPTTPLQTPVTGIGENLKYAIFRIGDKDKVLAPGIYDFFFGFTVTGAVRALKEEGRTGFVWDVTGGPTVPIDYAQVKIKLPEFTDPETVGVNAFLGHIANETREQQAFTPRNLPAQVSKEWQRSADEKEVYLTLKTTRTLRATERFVVKVSWPPGFLEGGL